MPLRRSVGDIKAFQNNFAFIISTETGFWLKRISDHTFFGVSDQGIFNPLIINSFAFYIICKNHPEGHFETLILHQKSDDKCTLREPIMQSFVCRPLPESVVPQENSPQTLYIYFHHCYFSWISVVRLIKFNHKCMHDHLCPNMPKYKSRGKIHFHEKLKKNEICVQFH